MQNKVRAAKVARGCHGILGGTSVPVPTLLGSHKRKIKCMGDLVKVQSSSAAYLIPFI